MKPFKQDYWDYHAFVGFFSFKSQLQAGSFLRNSWGASHGETFQLNLAAHVVGQVLQPNPRLGPRQPNAAHQRSAHVVTLGPEDVFHTSPNL